MQEPAADQPPADGGVSAADARGQALQDQDTLQADRHRPPLLCHAWADAGAAGYHPRLREHPGPYERQGQKGPFAHRQGPGRPRKINRTQPANQGQSQGQGQTPTIRTQPDPNQGPTPPNPGPDNN